MAQIANMTINDGATTPVAHVFTPIQSTPVALWRDTDAAKSYVVSQHGITLSRKQSTAANGLTRVKLTLSLPTMGTGVSLPASEVDYSHQVSVEFIMPNRGQKQERKNIRTFLSNLLVDAQVVDVIDEMRAAF